jgi:hypothetical protein
VHCNTHVTQTLEAWDNIWKALLVFIASREVKLQQVLDVKFPVQVGWRNYQNNLLNTQNKNECSVGFNHLSSQETPLAKSFSQIYSRTQEITSRLWKLKVHYWIHNNTQLDRMLKYINLIHNLTSCKFNSHLISSSHVHYIAYPKYPHPLSDYKFVGTSRSPKRVTCRPHHIPLVFYFTACVQLSLSGFALKQSQSTGWFIITFNKCKVCVVVQLGRALSYKPGSREFDSR